MDCKQKLVYQIKTITANRSISPMPNVLHVYVSCTLDLRLLQRKGGLLGCFRLQTKYVQSCCFQSRYRRLALKYTEAIHLKTILRACQLTAMLSQPCTLHASSPVLLEGWKRSLIPLTFAVTKGHP